MYIPSLSSNSSWLPTSLISPCWITTNLVTVYYCRKSVCNNKSCFSLHKFFQCILNKLFRFIIKGTCRLIQNKYLRIFKYCSCYWYSLFLTTWQFYSSFPNFSFISLFKFFYKFMCIGFFCGFYNLLNRSLLVSIFYIFKYCPSK